MYKRENQLRGGRGVFQATAFQILTLFYNYTLSQVHIFILQYMLAKCYLFNLI